MDYRRRRPGLLGPRLAERTNAGGQSEVRAQSCPPVDTRAIGPHAVTCTATDLAGNTSTAAATYTVIYAFGGFAAPLGEPDEVNLVKAGQVVPLRWRLTDASGQPITTLTSVTVTAATRACDPTDPVNIVVEVAASGTGLQNLGDGYYQYAWKTPLTYAGQCKTVRLDLGEGDGQQRTALFQLR